jgi:hypothetical protein
MFKPPKLESLAGPYGPLDTANGEIAFPYYISIQANDYQGAIIFWEHLLQVIVLKSILLGAFQNMCVRVIYAWRVGSGLPMVELAFKVNNKLYTSRMPISYEVAGEIKRD